MDADDRVMQLLEEFAAARARGERPDPLAYVARAGDDGPELRGLLDELLRSSASPAPPAEAIALMEALLDDEPPLLVLRRRRGLTVDGVTDRLMASLAIDGTHRPRVRALYQRLEAGRLGLAGVARRLRAQLADILGVDERDIGWVHAAPEGAVFARGPEGWRQALAALPPDGVPGPASEDVDALFGYRP